jgi:hypothetical protein
MPAHQSIALSNLWSSLCQRGGIDYPEITLSKADTDDLSEDEVVVQRDSVLEVGQVGIFVDFLFLLVRAISCEIQELCRVEYSAA